MTIKRDTIWKMLRAAFPDPVVEITETVVELAIRAMQGAWKPEYRDLFGIEEPDPSTLLPLTPTGGEQAATVPAGSPVYYIGHASHRRASPFTDEFIGHLPHVRVQLPADGQPAIETAGGIVYAGDHLMFNVAMVNEYLEDQAALFNKHHQVERVDLITPARFAGSRFGAIAVYLLYELSTDPTPFGYVLEAGMATGQPRTLYFSPAWDPIVRRSFYKPTPDADPKNFYRGRLKVASASAQSGSGWQYEAGDPVSLTVESFRESPLKNKNADPYHTTTVRYERVTSPGIVFPALLTLQAACRVALIEHTMGRELPDIGPLTVVLAELGRQLPWETMPGGAQ